MSGSFSPCVVFTQMWLTLLVVTPVNGQHEAAQQSVVSLQPPWTTFFRGEVVTLTCYRFGFSVPQKTKWYQKRKTVKQTPGALVIKAHTLKVHESGEYWCQADSLLPSMHVNVEFSEDFLVLQAPPAVFEGDSVVLRCYAKKGIEAETLTFYKDGKALTLHPQSSEFYIHRANLKDNGQYKCTSKKKWSFGSLYTSNTVVVQVQELFPRPVLRARPSHPIDGSPVTLTCQTQLSAQKSDARLQFCFFRNLQLLGSGCSRSSEFHIPAIWTEESKRYQCKAETVNSQVSKQSTAFIIPVQRASARFQTHIIPASKLVFEGQLLLLNCSVKGVPGPLKFSWYKKDMLNKETKILKSSNAEFKISQVNISDAGEYYCEANNSRRSFVSRAFPITIKVPVSQPVLTLSTGKTQALEGDLMTLHCQSQRGSPCILYEFFYENVSLGNSSILSGGGAYFNFSMSTERSGNYYCTADNGLGAQCSEAIRISIFDMTKNRSVPMAAGITVGLLIMAVGVFLFYCWFSRKAGGKPTSDDSRNPSDSEPQEPTYYNVPACIELQPVYSNEPEENVIYTEVRRTQPRQKHADQESESPRSRCQMAEKK
ncbi:Fc receptor-like protein 5 isoform a precursor [Mus musculus]|uniref:Fc receptor-like protein 5 n=1 Tax=Mus musculus TaxID=10090 RepID=FCRL5_MOUSE|nr:Fc receptor-like protein 5 isoform a precursor [Mus musculus]Q68SN8.3 RecName: Full=Fc receptor-like protein 5; Short=FcR-like protein 5; Short=FcRL5; AltName: Full=BXMAS1-like protein 2; Short=mBXMH2; AltName: Full=Fc receptor homolog 3; Short=FcRH3; Short=moFcRH3; AltName: CD_antigen=CD307e; Flags: Precursor [Mus musculus]|eukprot:NP_899045.3 Fc receptor-like protein 5 isoform a precursor [Mus musculus]